MFKQLCFGALALAGSASAAEETTPAAEETTPAETNDQWISAIIMLILGLVIAFQGKKHFPYVAALVAGGFALQLVIWGADGAGWLKED